MPRKNAYVCSLTEKHVKRIEDILKFIAECDVKTEREKAAKHISMILKVKGIRKYIN